MQEEEHRSFVSETAYIDDLCRDAWLRGSGRRGVPNR